MLLQFLVNFLYLLVGVVIGAFICTGMVVVFWMVYRADVIDILDTVDKDLREENPGRIVVVEQFLKSKFR